MLLKLIDFELPATQIKFTEPGWSNAHTHTHTLFRGADTPERLKGSQKLEGN